MKKRKFRRFRLHPTEICGSLVYRLYKDVERGDYPTYPVHGSAREIPSGATTSSRRAARGR